MTSAGFAYQGATADPFGTSEGNKGCWGAELNYAFTAGNTAGDGKAWGASVHLVCRGTGLPWYGAAKIVDPDQYPSWGVDPPLNSSGTYKQTKLTVGTSGADKPVYVADGASKTIKVRVVNGGGCTLPVNITVTGMIAYEEPEGGG